MKISKIKCVLFSYDFRLYLIEGTYYYKSIVNNTTTKVSNEFVKGLYTRTNIIEN